MRGSSVSKRSRNTPCTDEATDGPCSGSGGEAGLGLAVSRSMAVLAAAAGGVGTTGGPDGWAGAGPSPAQGREGAWQRHHLRYIPRARRSGLLVHIKQVDFHHFKSFGGAVSIPL